MNPEIRIQELVNGLSTPESQSLLKNLVDGFNAIYDPNGNMNLIVQVHSRETDTTRTWEAHIIDNYTIPGKQIRVVVHPDKTIDAPIIIDPSV